MCRCSQWYCSRVRSVMMAPGRTLFRVEVVTCTPWRRRRPHRARAPGALRPRPHGGHRRGGARAGHQGHPLLGRRRPGAVPDERERAHRQRPHLVPGRERRPLPARPPRQHRHRGPRGRAGALRRRDPRGDGRPGAGAQAAGPPAAGRRAHAHRPLLRLPRARVRRPAPPAPHRGHAERPARPAHRGGGRGRAARQGVAADRHADAAARRHGHAGHEHGRDRSAPARAGGVGALGRAHRRERPGHRRGGPARGSSAATSCSTASWSGSSWRRRHRPPAPSSWTWRSPSCSGSSRWTCSSAATRSSPRGASAAACCATSSPGPAPRTS